MSATSPHAPELPLGGSVAAGFEQVQAAFVENFTSRGEVGAALCVVIDHRVVVDLWGGWAGPVGSRPFEADTLVDVFSVGKGLSACCLARLHGEGRFEIEAPVSAYWPEFAAAGKAEITVGQLLSHRAGLPAVRKRLAPGSMLDHGVMAAALAAETPWWEPGTAHGYHTNTFGFLAGELVRRVDGRSIGTVLREDVAGPLGADVHIGLPDAEHDRVAEFLWSSPAPPEQEPPGLSAEALMEYNCYYNPSGLSGAGVVNTAEWRRAEVPSANGHATARGVARLYEALAAGGTLEKVSVVSETALDRFTTEWSAGTDLVLHRPSRFGLGFQLTQPERPFGTGRYGFGHFGAGGAVGFCDPDARLSFAYVINSMGPRWQNPRNRALIETTYATLA